ncbi:MAG: sn-glycerol-3-phosphate ABC transporter ATP-binding protein UgpC [Roseitalea porphyridii]|uniref:ABC transporter ATP-binding protein n=1 Tax=Roseitalea porphyridii TaxID=1852022 RepID=UPI0032D953BB
MSSVLIENVIKNYGAFEAIRDVSFEIESGSFVILIGPSGCGKSTLLRMIAGLEDISGGTISIGDKVVNDVASKDRDIAMVFQNYALYPHMTVEENMGFSLSLRRIDKATIEDRVQHAAEILGLDALLERYPKQLSGGQRQRVAMGRAIVRDPQVFLFDEPLSNLDAKLRVQMRTEIKGLHQRLKTTTVYVTHDQIEAMTMADKIVVMRQGVIEQIGAPLDLYDRPANLFVAQFIGSPAMNIIDATLDADGAYTADGIKLPMPNGHNDARSDGRLVKWGVRPEHLEIADHGLPATVDLIEPTGAETLVLARIGTTKVVAASRQRQTLEPGAAIHLAPLGDRIHLFDAESGLVI